MWRTETITFVIAECVLPGDVIEDSNGESRKVVGVRTFEPYDSVQISCRGHYYISTRKGRYHRVTREGV